jgi:hypothetical protein
MGEEANIEFFGCKIKCRSPHLAALLNSDVNENVVVVGQRAAEVLNSEVMTIGGHGTRIDDEEAEECLGALAEVISLHPGAAGN